MLTHDGGLNSRVCLRTLWSSDYVPQSQYVIRLKSSLPHLQESLDWEIKDLTDLIDPVLDLVLGGGGRVRTCSLQVMGLTSRPITLPRYRSKPGSNSCF